MKESNKKPTEYVARPFEFYFFTSLPNRILSAFRKFRMISEILVAATKDEGALLVYDAQSLAHLGSFKGNQCDTHGLTPVYKPNSGGRIMSLLASQSDKSFFHEWQMQKVISENFIRRFKKLRFRN